jgi:coproporphyrinogen III oxidase
MYKNKQPAHCRAGFSRRLSRLFFRSAIALSLGVVSGIAFGQATGGKTSTLSDEDRAMFSTFFNGFVADMDTKYFGQVEALNGGIEFEDRTSSTEYADYELRVARGDVMEKAGRMLSHGKKTNPGRGDGVLTWGRFYSLDMHPKTPLVGMLHATIVLQMFEDGTVGTGGWLGVMPGTRVDEDLALLKKLTDDYFAQHDKDPSLYRTLICKGTHDTITEFRRRPACSGVSFYGPPVYRGDPEASIRFIAGLFDEFVGAYMDIVTQRADDTFTEADVIAQKDMRRRWLIDQLFSDPFASKIVPFEVWSFANVPPVITF